MSIIPITFRELFKLQNLGITEDSIYHDSVTMESDRFICVRDKSPQRKGITIIDSATQETSSIGRAVCESAIMNPATRVIALRMGDKLQTYNLEMKAPMKKTSIPEPVEYWTWISPKDIAIVTSNSVYHWSMAEEGPPVKMFDKHSSFEGATVVNYRTDSTMTWLLLIGFQRVEGGAKGVMQLFSVAKKVTQPIEGHAATFLNYKISPTLSVPIICIASTDVTQANEGKMFVMQVPQSSQISFRQKKVIIRYDNPGDFPVAMEGSDRFGVIYLLTKNGYLYIFDVETATLMFKNRITGTPIFATCVAGDGFNGVNRGGQVLHAGIDEEKIIPYLMSIGQSDIALKISARGGIAGVADDLYRQKFEQCIAQGQIVEAVTIAATSPNQVLRTPEIISRIARLPMPMSNPKPPLSLYFQHIIENVGALNAYETLELAKIVLQRAGGLDYLKNLMTKEQLSSSQELGDMVRQHDVDLAMKIYFEGKAYGKIVTSLIDLGKWQRVLAFLERVPDYEPDFNDLFRQLLRVDHDAAVSFATKVYTTNKESIDPLMCVNSFKQMNLIKQATAFLLGILNEDREEDAALQTMLLEINLRHSPVQVVDSILGNNMYTHYDHFKIAQLCEAVQLYQRALENYTDINDVKRVIVHTQFINHEWLIDFFGDMLPEESLACLYELMQHNPRMNLKIVVQVATKYSGEIHPEKLVDMFEHFKSFNGLYVYLSSLVDKTQDPELVFKFIEAAVRCNQLVDVERITRENDVYDGQLVKEFLKESRLQNQEPLVNVCDKHDFIPELVRYLYNNKFFNYIDMYVKQRNPLKTPEVVAALIDCDCPEEYLRKLLQSVGSLCPVEPLVAVVEEKGQLKLLRPWLESRVEEGNTDQVLHNAIAKIYIDVNHSPEEFLLGNDHYDCEVIGEYCEKRRDPHLAYLAYRKGKCDRALIDLTDRNGMFKQQAVYLIGRRDEELWLQVLSEENPNRKLLIDQIVQSALMECDDADDIHVCVHAFIVAKLHRELIELLEQIVLKGKPKFRSHGSLQDLLIITAVRADPDRVMGYLSRLDKYDGPKIAAICVKKGLFEEALQIYKNFQLHPDALGVLLRHIDDLERGEEYTAQVDTDECWAILGREQLLRKLSDRAMDSFLKAKNTDDYRAVIQTVKETGHFVELIKYLTLARTHGHHDTMIDTEMVYAYARVAHESPTPNNFADLEDFVASPHQANVQQVGERCFEEEMYESARILFTSVKNFAKLASTLIRLGKNREAVAAAQQANSIKTWKEVLKACVQAGEFRYAQSCGLNIIVHADEIEELIFFYESLGHFDEAIKLLEKGIGLSHESQKGIPTALGVLYAKYHPERLMEHLQRYYRRTHIPRLLAVCEQNHMWAEMRFLYYSNKNFDDAINVMIDHSVEAWDHAVFTEIIVQVINMEKYYAAICFYLDEHPEHIHDLLMVLIGKLDHERVAKEYMDSQDLPLMLKYFESVQDKNLFFVNEAVNKLYIEQQNYEALRESIDHYDEFDSAKLARSLQDHELLEFRRISASLYRRSGKFAESIELSKKDKLYKDAMQTAAESNDREVAEGLLGFFVESGLHDCFAACLYVCYHLVRPDVALEFAWKHRIMDMVMPYMIQMLREYTGKIDTLTRRLAEKDEEERAQQAAQPVAGTEVFGGMDPLAGAPPAGPFGGMPPVGGMPPTGGMDPFQTPFQ